MFVGWICRYLTAILLQKKYWMDSKPVDVGKSGSTEIYFTIDQTFDKVESIGIHIWKQTSMSQDS